MMMHMEENFSAHSSPRLDSSAERTLNVHSILLAKDSVIEEMSLQEEEKMDTPEKVEKARMGSTQDMGIAKVQMGEVHTLTEWKNPTQQQRRTLTSQKQDNPRVRRFNNTSQERKKA